MDIVETLFKKHPNPSLNYLAESNHYPDLAYNISIYLISKMRALVWENCNVPFSSKTRGFNNVI